MNDYASNAPSVARPLSHDEYEEKLKGLRTMKDVSQFARDLIGPTLQAMLEAELTAHLGHDKHERTPAEKINYRNGHFPKTVKGNLGNIALQVPRDRNGSFAPIAVKKHETMESDVEEKIISMYAKGMTTRDIHDHMQDIYGIEVSAAMVSMITEKVMPLVREWQARPLASTYVVLYLDGIHFKVRDSGRIVTKCAYTILGLNHEGMKEILGIWVGGNEGAKFWLQVLTDLKQRGVEDVIIAAVDGLTGFGDAITAVFPKADVQQCVVHMIRNTIKYLPHAVKDKVCASLRTIYTAPTEEAAVDALAAVKIQWPEFAAHLTRWEIAWKELSPMFRYPPELRRIIYTTNAVENVHRQFRKVTKTTTIFSDDDALAKLLWLAQRDMAKKWTQPLPVWGTVMRHLAIMYPERISLT